MLRHTDIWRAIERLAQENGLSPSGLARQAGLDPTTFNKSKRTTREGKLRWPSTESIAKILNATNTSIGEFVSYLSEDTGGGVFRNIPLIGFGQAGDAGYFDDAGYPSGTGWDEIPFPGLGDPHAYALEISGDSMAPVYRDGDIVIVGPSASIRRGDRVVVKTQTGEVLVKQLLRHSARRIDLQSLNPLHEDRSFDVDEVEWMSRIVWVSQ
ncbi:MAG: helix-turn-helix transcriptional regulator [Rhodospirillaceae bacterium]|jgi:phage repressor protein C with HTH and peptisase S24 domain